MGEEKRYETDMRLLRQQAKLKLQFVADAIGISKQSLSDWELGMLDLKLRVEQTEKLLEIYGISFAELVAAWKATEKRPTRREVKENAKAKEAVEMN